MHLLCFDYAVTVMFYVTTRQPQLAGHLFRQRHKRKHARANVPFSASYGTAGQGLRNETSVEMR